MDCAATDVRLTVTCLLTFYINWCCQVDEYGTQQPIALLKLLFERGGFYGRGKYLSWKNVKDLGMYMIILDLLSPLIKCLNFF